MHIGRLRVSQLALESLWEHNLFKDLFEKNVKNNMVEKLRNLKMVILITLKPKQNNRKKKKEVLTEMFEA